MKITCTNRKAQRITLLVEHAENAKGTAFIAHGLSGFKEQTHIAAMAQAFYEAGFTAVRWDAANTLGESGGKLENASLTSYFEDFEDVVSWARKQEWFKEPVFLSGHSLGAACTLLYAKKYPTQVRGIIPVSCFVSGKSYANARRDQIAKWQKQGYLEEASESRPGVTKRLNWSCMEDLYAYDMHQTAKQVHTPTLFMPSGEDEIIPLADEAAVFEALSSEKKEYTVIEGALHTFRADQQLEQVKSTINKWLEQF